MAKKSLNVAVINRVAYVSINETRGDSLTVREGVALDEAGVRRLINILERMEDGDVDSQA